MCMHCDLSCLLICRELFPLAERIVYLSVSKNTQTKEVPTISANWFDFFVSKKWAKRIKFNSNFKIMFLITAWLNNSFTAKWPWTPESARSFLSQWLDYKSTTESIVLYCIVLFFSYARLCVTGNHNDRYGNMPLWLLSCTPDIYLYCV